MVTLAVAEGKHADFPSWKRAFSTLAPDLDVIWWEDALQTPQNVEYLLVWQPEHGLAARFANLRAILCVGAGVDHLLADPHWPHDVPLVRMGGQETAALMEEYVTWACLSLLRETRTWAWQQERRIFHRKLVTRTAATTTVGIMGMGHLGTQVARRLRDFGFQVRGWSRRRRELAGVRSFAGQAELADFLSGTDILVSLLPNTPRTRDMIDADLLSRLPRGAALVNVGRGEQVCEDALLAALGRGHLSGAVLDVFREEPLSPDSALWDHPAITISPHAASEASRAEQAAYMVQVIHEIERGGTPALLYNAERGY
ncbi:glyoxylate/hydroxypyruvate reductase A [Gluconacetobacter entanii]|uniref:2-hydroxyacid dehydrogenase n=1 Tax=Gluconacetobacter entanii TaxID=108528 RepID=UPI001C93704B|nr:glyoxylate/hydroxypyruvate reductase A [Gluconacetobacter entanii]MBY4640074.1 glyoxylate/hydroxypyruvate reductase A [Gluconacetobacter entanii]MCW4581432.1 glyoxylate/hydroxypyruvate reductase A [Gluconacetobacter entanii]MCW4584728.1 glyoxylate/hydroxypyruvate reductase A [Gluconacetobacter entanii]MCW4588142.1 glyoxylate/hydroxypyruvate reductase A [Gluconacetobacter entanii]